MKIIINKKVASDDTDDEVIPVIEIDKLIHEPARLLIISFLYVIESANFLGIQRQTKLSDGNLSSHLSKLESACNVTVEKSIKNKKTNTQLKLSKGGREAFEVYRKKMTQILAKTEN